MVREQMPEAGFGQLSNMGAVVDDDVEAGRCDLLRD
jgi:hypothetical protein